MKVENLVNMIKNEFSGKIAQEKYVKDSLLGLWKSEKKLIKKYFKVNSLNKIKSKILDVGCGTGRTTLSLFNMGYDVLGIDFVHKMIFNAKKIALSKKLNIKYQVGDAADLNFKDNFFDYVLFSFNGLEQIPDKNRRLVALQEINRVLKKKGIFIFTTHRRNMSLKWFLRWLKYYVGCKLFRFSINEVDYGDIFWSRLDNKGNKSTQFIHVMSDKEVRVSLKLANFQCIETVSTLELGDNFGKYRYYFYVCKKK